MKTKLLLLLFLIGIAFPILTSAQKTIILQPDSCFGKDALIGDCVPCGYYNMNFGSSDEFSAIAWTNGGNASNSRALIEFDLGGIPVNAVIVSASLSFYHNPNPASGNPGHSQTSGSNAAILQRITSSWTEFGVTWANQPLTTAQNQVTLPASTSNNQDYTNINVTALIQDMVNNPLQSFGFMLSLESESYYRGLLFASSDYPNSALRPKLEVTYMDTTNAICMTLRPDNSICNEGKDAIIGDCVPCGYYNMNFGTADEFSAIAWTNGGNASNSRALIEFELNTVPPNSTIISALLSLYHNPNPASGNPGHSQTNGSNAALLQRVTSSWTELGVTWANQPSTTTLNQATVPASASNNQDYPNIDVTALVQDMVNNPSQSFGFMLRLETESYYRGLLFASSDHPNAALHPKLELCYSMSSGISEHLQDNLFSIYPNPLTSYSTIFINERIKDAVITIYDVPGKEVFREKVTGNRIEIEKASLSNGIYFVKVKNNDSYFVRKIIVQ